MYKIERRGPGIDSIVRATKPRDGVHGVWIQDAKYCDNRYWLPTFIPGDKQETKFVKVDQTDDATKSESEQE